MRIALIVEAFPTVSETFISNKVKQLSARGYTVCVFCSRLNKPLFVQLFEKMLPYPCLNSA